MNVSGIIRVFTENFKQMCREFCEEKYISREKTLDAKDYARMVEMLKSATSDAGIASITQYVESCDSPARVILADGVKTRFKEVVPKEFHVGFGVATIHRRVYQADNGGTRVVPLDIMFNVVDEYFFPDIREAVLYAVASTPSEEVVENMTRFGLRPPSLTAVRRLTNDTNAKMEAERNAIGEKATLAGRIPDGEVPAIVVSMDGASVLVREDAEDSRKYRASYKMAMAGTVGLYGPPSLAEDGTLNPERIASSGFARMPEEKYPTFKNMLDMEAANVAAALPADTVKILLQDGAAPLWKHAENNPVYDGYLKLIDYYHMSEHLHAAAETLFGPGMAASREWEEKWKGALLENDGAALGVTRSIEYYLNAKRLPKKRKEDARKELTYFRNNNDRMDYAWFRKRGLPIGSGPIEACCKSLIKCRMCRSGMSWSVEGGQAVLTLRAHRKAGDWSKMWTAYMEIRQESYPILEMAA
jgi:hypothetical protein